MNVTIGSTRNNTTQAARPRRTHFQSNRRARGGPGGRLSPPPDGRRGGPGGTGGPGGRGGLPPSRAALTASMGSRSFGSRSSRTAGRIAVGLSSGGTGPRAACLAPPGGGADAGRGRGAGSACRGGCAPSAPDPCGFSAAERSLRPSLFTGRTRALARSSGSTCLRGTRCAQHIGLDQVIPFAGSAYLHHVYRKFVVTRRQHDQLLITAGRTRHRAEMVTENPRHERELLLAAYRAHHRTRLAVELRGAQQIRVGVTHFADASPPRVDLGQQ